MPPQDIAFPQPPVSIAELRDRSVVKRWGQRDILPTGIKERLLKNPLVLGGSNNKGGALYIKDADGLVKLTQTKDGIKGSDGSNTRIFISTTGVIKVSKPGYDADTTNDLNLAFNSDYSMFREVQMQTNAEQRFTDQSSYQEYEDCQIHLDMADWEDHNMYFECVMKTGAGTGFMRLYNKTDSSQLVEISTTSTTAVSVRSSAISKSALSGEKDFREDQKITGGGAAFTDVYIGRVIMRYDFT